MHLFNDNSPVPPKGQVIMVWCDRTAFSTGLDTHDIGRVFFETHAYDLLYNVVKVYIEYCYQSPQSRDFIYANFLKDQFGMIAESMEYVVTTLTDDCAHATDTHSEMSENIMEYFNQDINVVCDAVSEMYAMFHGDLYHPITDMVELCKTNGLTLSPDSVEIHPYGYLLGLLVMEDEFAYDEYDDGHTYPCSPFRLGIPPVRTTAEIGLPVYRDINGTVRQVVHSHTTVPLQYPVYAG